MGTATIFLFFIEREKDWKKFSLTLDILYEGIDANI